MTPTWVMCCSWLTTTATARCGPDEAHPEPVPVWIEVDDDYPVLTTPSLDEDRLHEAQRLTTELRAGN